MKADAELQLIQRCARGEEAAWNSLFDDHYEDVYRFLNRQNHEFTPTQVEAMCHDVFLAAIQNVASFQSRGGLRIWLCRIAMNRGRTLIEENRKARGGTTVRRAAAPVRPRRGNAPAPSVPQPKVPSTPEEQFIQLRDALDHLGGPARDLIELHFFGSLAAADLAVEFEMSIRSMRARLRKCLKRLEEIVPELTHQLGNAQSSQPAVP